MFSLLRTSVLLNFQKNTLFTHRKFSFIFFSHKTNTNFCWVPYVLGFHPQIEYWKSRKWDSGMAKKTVTNVCYAHKYNEVLISIHVVPMCIFTVFISFPRLLILLLLFLLLLLSSLLSGIRYKFFFLIMYVLWACSVCYSVCVWACMCVYKRTVCRFFI